MKTALSFLALLLSLSAAPSSPWAADPIPVPKPIFFASGASSSIVSGHVIRGERDLYLLGASAGDNMTVIISAPDNNAVFQIYEPGTKVSRDEDGTLAFKGKALPGAGEGEDATRWRGSLPRKGAYLIVVGGTRGNARYSVEVKIE